MDDDSVRIGGASNWLVLSRDEIGAEHGQRSVWSLWVELHADGLVARTSIWLGPKGVEERLDDFFARPAVD